MPSANPRLTEAEAMLRAGQAARAKAVLLRAAAQDPRDGEAGRLLAIALSALGEHEQAVFYARRAAAASPTNPDTHLLVINALHNAGHRAESIGAARAALALHPRDARIRETLADACFAQSLFADAEAECRAGLQVHPGDVQLTLTLAATMINVGRLGEAWGLLERVTGEMPHHPGAASALAQLSTYMPGLRPEQVSGVHRSFGRVLERLVPGPPAARPRRPDPERRLRVGFVSADFRTHSVAYFLEPLLAHLDRGAFEVVCYHTALARDGTTERFRALADVWRDAAEQDIRRLAALIGRDEPDILVDLSGHTDGPRLGVFHLRPAPVQVSYLGYPATTGVGAVGVRIVDSTTDPAEAQGWCVERLVRLDPCFLCYRPPAGAPDPAPGVPSAGAGHVTFGTFNVMQKINDPLLRLWRGVLDAVPGSRLLIKNHGLVQAEVRASVERRLAAAGFDASRVELIGATMPLMDHLALYRRVDVALDTFPYHGTTTTCEALWMGVPVVTLLGPMHAARVGATLLACAGLSDLVATSEEGYIRVAAGLGADEARRRALRGGLRGTLERSPLRDEAGAADRFGALLRAAWRDACGRA
ncbi:MAG: hypothetical protein U0637_03805 [Phycisphaerales bacterium]